MGEPASKLTERLLEEAKTCEIRASRRSGRPVVDLVAWLTTAERFREAVSALEQAERDIAQRTLERDNVDADYRRDTEILAARWRNARAALEQAEKFHGPQDAQMETCQDCGFNVAHVWHVSEELWAKVSSRTDRGGILCVTCAERRAVALGLSLYWEAREQEWPSCSDVPCPHQESMILNNRYASEEYERRVAAESKLERAEEALRRIASPEPGTTTQTDWEIAPSEALGLIGRVRALDTALEQAENALQRLASHEGFNGAIDLRASSRAALAAELAARGMYAEEALAVLGGARRA